MALSRFEYVKGFEHSTALLKNCFIVVRIDGCSFSRFTKTHEYRKPVDVRGVDLMNQSAIDVMKAFNDISIAFGQSDEYSFVFPRETTLYGRRESKIATGIVSLFTASFVRNWSAFFPDTVMDILPSFDARCVLYPSDTNMRDYLSWRQADTHINNLVLSISYI